MEHVADRNRMHLIIITISKLKLVQLLNHSNCEADIVDDNGNSCCNGGHLVIKSTWPSCSEHCTKDPDRYIELIGVVLKTHILGDVARKDEDGYFDTRKRR